MADVADLLVEIGTEELPPRSLESLSAAFASELVAALGEAGLEPGEAVPFATPRRLAVLVREVPTSQPERQSERRGPALSAAFDADGNPTKAALGFAKSCGVDVEFLERLETDKGSWLVFRTTEVAQLTESLIGPIVNDVLARLPAPRRMRWGSLDVEFPRPVHWVVLRLGDTVIETEIFGVTSGTETRGHRFHHPEGIAISAPEEYEKALYGGGFVMADLAARRAMIETQVADAAAEVGGRALLDDDLVAEVTALVEWPVAVVGSFDEEFLELPDAVLVATMKGHQKYFPVAGEDGALLPHFVTVSNIQSTNPDAVREGNERVIRPRLADAAFFFRADLERTLESWREGLDDIVFHRELGSLGEKTQRVSSLAGHVAIAMGQSPDEVKLARRAGRLCKCDLLSEMVAEFPELQGFMGREYAARGGETEAVAAALEEAYRPRFAGDAIAQSPTGQALAIADKLDTLIGIFGVGQVPSGDKDPYALRRAALGALRTMIEGRLDVDLTKLLAAAATEYGDRLTSETVADDVFEFMLDRLRAYFVEQDVPPGVFAAVQARQPRRPYDFARRIRAVDEFRRLPEAASLSAANKRIQNILKQVDDAVPDAVEDALLSEDAEWNLAAKLVGLTPRVGEMLKKGEYTEALKHLASLRDSVDAFFDSVKVMDDDTSVRNNRLALLNNLGTLFMQTADISRLQE